MLPFTIEELNRQIAEGNVTRRRHPDDEVPYYIYNYSPETQYRRYWNDVTLNCRGLILDTEYNVIARPWKKFFNLGEVELPLQFDTPVEVMDKADGSLGILYTLPDGSRAISTRGSMDSTQARIGTELLEQYPLPDDYMTLELLDRYTFLFEIIYPKNRIVLNYGDRSELIMLGAVDKKLGHYVGPKVAAAMIAWPGPVIEVFNYNTISDALGQMDRKNAEGYVIRSHNFLVKLKQPDYLELHKLVTNLSPKTVWESLRDGKTVLQVCSAFPDEFRQMAEDIAIPLMAAFVERKFQIENDFRGNMNNIHKYNSNPSRKDYAKVFAPLKDAKFFFSLLDGRDIDLLVWKDIQPRESILND